MNKFVMYSGIHLIATVLLAALNYFTFPGKASVILILVNLLLNFVYILVIGRRGKK